MGDRGECESELLVRVRVILAEIPRGRIECSFSRMDEPTAEMHGQQWRLRRGHYKNTRAENLFYSGESSLLHLAWDSISTVFDIESE
jgi:hypothetical protein